MRSIHERLFPPKYRVEAGRWEGDPIIGKFRQSAIGTLVQRQTRPVRLLHLPRRVVRTGADPSPSNWNADSDSVM